MWSLRFSLWPRYVSISSLVLGSRQNLRMQISPALLSYSSSPLMECFGPRGVDRSVWRDSWDARWDLRPFGVSSRRMGAGLRPWGATTLDDLGSTIPRPLSSMNLRASTIRGNSADRRNLPPKGSRPGTLCSLGRELLQERGISPRIS